MKYENAAITFIIVLLADVFLYWMARASASDFLSTVGKLFFMGVVVLALVRFLFTSQRYQKKASALFYTFLLVITVILLIAQLIVSVAVVPIVDYFFMFAVLIAIFLAIVELGKHFYVLHRVIERERLARLAEQKEYSSKLNEEIGEKTKLAREYERLSKLSEKYQEHIKAKDANLKKLRSESASTRADLKKAQKLASEAEKQEALKKQYAKRVAELRKKSTETASELRKAKKFSKEAEKQEVLKKQYAKTLYNLRKKQKEDEELLVVSPDGKSVHDVGCITVRNISKENRKLIKNWKTAEKEGYKGCKLCNPHKKDKPIVKNGRKYKFVGAKSSDKLHKANCKLVERIKPAERELFANYKAGLKKGYTACRVCNPGQ